MKPDKEKYCSKSRELLKLYMGNSLTLHHYFPELKIEIDNLLKEGLCRENYEHDKKVCNRLNQMKERGLDWALENK